MNVKKGLGKIAWLVGIIGAVILALLGHFDLVAMPAWVPTVLVVAGILIGLLNIQGGEVQRMMLAALLLGSASLGLAFLGGIGGLIEVILGNLGTVAVPAGVVIAIKVLISDAK